MKIRVTIISECEMSEEEVLKYYGVLDPHRVVVMGEIWIRHNESFPVGSDDDVKIEVEP